MSDSQGGKAVRSGQEYREQIRHLLVSSGGLHPISLPGLEPGRIAARMQAELSQSRPLLEATHSGIVAEDAPLCLGLYRSPLLADFVIQKWDWPEPLALLVQSQDGKGSADGKVACDIEGAVQRCPIPFGSVLLGEWFERTRPSVASYAQERLTEVEKGFRAFVGMGALTTWVIRDGMRNERMPSLFNTAKAG